jgi:ElaB/YqjD/DUF883 family membrane-anchored ribosome-binding protein
MTEAQIAAAEQRVVRARGRLTDALGALKERLLPGNIARSVAHGLAEKSQDAAKAGVDAVKARPAAALGVAALAGLFLARKPIARALGGEESDQPDETPAASPRSAANPVTED